MIKKPHPYLLLNLENFTIYGLTLGEERRRRRAQEGGLPPPEVIATLIPWSGGGAGAGNEWFRAEAQPEH